MVSKRQGFPCANCMHCKLLPLPENTEGRYKLRVRCEAGKWQKPGGGEKIYKYCTVVNRKYGCCDAYETMGDDKEFLSDLKIYLPSYDEIYTRCTP